MDSNTSLITTMASICVVLFGIFGVGAALYGILIWLPAREKRKVDALKAAGKQGQATILRLPDLPRPYSSSNRAVFKMVRIGLEIRVPGEEPYEVDKVFTIPSGAVRLLVVGKVVPVWIDPQAPLNLDKIVIHIDE